MAEGRLLLRTFRLFYLEFLPNSCVFKWHFLRSHGERLGRNEKMTALEVCDQSAKRNTDEAEGGKSHICLKCETLKHAQPTLITLHFRTVLLRPHALASIRRRHHTAGIMCPKYNVRLTRG